MNEIRVLIVEDEPLIAEDIAATLQQADYAICRIAYSQEDALAALEEDSPDIVLLDINLNGGTEGIEIAQLISRQYQLPFIFLTSYSDKLTLEKAKQTGPGGYIVKPFSEATLYTTIEIGLHNHARKNSASYPEPRLSKINAGIPAALSEREFDVLIRIYNGMTNQQIADEMFVSVNTIKKHINSAYLKVDAMSRSKAISRMRELMMK